MKISTIFWDVDGVLADLNFAYFNFLKNHPNYRDDYRDLEWQDLEKVYSLLPGNHRFNLHAFYGNSVIDNLRYRRPSMLKPRRNF